jgi:hypothetical protein
MIFNIIDSVKHNIYELPFCQNFITQKVQVHLANSAEMAKLRVCEGYRQENFKIYENDLTQ